MFLQAVFCASAKLVEIPSSLCHADYRDVEVSSFHHCLQGRKNLFVREIAGGAEKNERVRLVTGHESLSFKQPQICLLAFLDVRRIQSASRTAVCRRSRLRRVN